MEINVSLDKIAKDIIALFPEDVPLPAETRLQMIKIMEQLGMLSGVIDALQQTAGEVFSQHKQGNTDIAEKFFDALLTITVPRRSK